MANNQVHLVAVYSHKKSTTHTCIIYYIEKQPNFYVSAGCGGIGGGGGVT